MSGVLSFDDPLSVALEEKRLAGLHTFRYANQKGEEYVVEIYSAKENDCASTSEGMIVEPMYSSTSELHAEGESEEVKILRDKLKMAEEQNKAFEALRNKMEVFEQSRLKAKARSKEVPYHGICEKCGRKDVPVTVTGNLQKHALSYCDGKQCHRFVNKKKYGERELTFDEIMESDPESKFARHSRR